MFPPVLVIAGPTASRKSAVAMALAERCQGAIVNADSQQVYEGLPILTAQPSLAEQKKCPHFLFGVRPPSLRLSAWEWVQQAVAVLSTLLADGVQPILVGGTGFYLKTLMEGLSPIPLLTPEQRTATEERLAKEGASALWHALSQVDPESSAHIGCSDAYRLTRAWAIFEQTKIPYSQWKRQPREKLGQDLTYHVIGFLPAERQKLYDVINGRFVSMVQEGGMEEVKALRCDEGYQEFPAYQALGVAALDQYLSGLCSWEDAIKQGQQHSRQYAKRQLTWFRHQQLFQKILDPVAPGRSLASLVSEIVLA